ncbi:hypothetical protein LR48_Vigan01g143200 [Vigna angularis]|uniref:Uncharacterized protein n=1 Tax=Phaseolus angularis TaxID=3914 RepID=A0A0L9TN23_PHAAN|nr:hypothetical protein LR48_Vigan01g143200 [Vigna angularis]
MATPTPRPPLLLTPLSTSWSPPPWGLSADVAHLPFLSSLSLTDNKFSGPILSPLSSLSALHFLNLSNNGFNQTFPPKLSYLQRLEVLDLYNNNITIPLPLVIAQMLNLPLDKLGSSWRRITLLVVEERLGLEPIDTLSAFLEAWRNLELTFILEGQRCLMRSLEGKLGHALPKCKLFISLILSLELK